uniref:Uncharacterized protein n=1 Tax=Anguilla anguilla TaxID=7936 RepID=A0A0E9UPB7_ANGAN
MHGKCFLLALSSAVHASPLESSMGVQTFMLFLLFNTYLIN